MPSSKPVIAVRLSPHVFEVFRRLAELQGKSRGGILAEILESIYPPLMRTVALLEAAAEAPVQVRQGLVRTLEDVELDLVRSLGGGLAQLDLLIQRSVEADSSPAGPQGGQGTKPSRGGSRKAGKGGSTPVPVTRGSGRVFRGSAKASKRPVEGS